MSELHDSPESKTAIEIIDAIAPEGWRSKMAMVAAQLLAGTKWGAEYYTRVRDVKDHADSKSRVNAIVAEAVGQQAISDPQIMERAKARFLGNIYQQQANIEAVIEATTPLLADKEPPRPIGEDSAEHPPLETDWAAAFHREAEQATSDELRERLAKLLAGEMVQPGKFPRSTIRMIAELDHITLLNFEQILKYRFQDVIYVPEDWKEGDRLGPLLDAEAARLLVNAAQPLSRNMTIGEDGKGYLFGNKFILMFVGSVGTQATFPIVRITRDGRAVADLLTISHEEKVLAKVAGNVDKTNLSSIFLLERDLVDGEQGYYLKRQLWPEPASASSGPNPFEAPTISK